MKYILCVLSLSAMALCMKEFQKMSPELLLTIQQVKKRNEIIDAFNECNLTWPVDWKEGTKMFRQKPIFVGTSKTAKCHMDCTMRKIGVMTDSGFQAEKYITSIKQLYRNYTRDLSAENAHVKESILSAINFFAESDDNEILQTFERVAQDCKNKKDLYDNDHCETTFRVAKCIIDKGLTAGWHLAVYPFAIPEQ